MLVGSHDRTPDADPTAAEHLETLFGEGRRYEITVCNPSTESDQVQLALVGVYGAVSYGLFQRTREMGIRLALGTTPGGLRAMLLGQTLIIVGAGAVAGVVLTTMFGTYMASLVKNASPDARLTAVALASIGILTATAIWSATRHVSRLDIAEVLRAESAD